MDRICESGKVAQSCDSYIHNSYSDWFLLSGDELDLMYKNLKQKGLDSFAVRWY
jgi:hypothetical protein